MIGEVSLEAGVGAVKGGLEDWVSKGGSRSVAVVFLHQEGLTHGWVSGS